MMVFKRKKSPTTELKAMVSGKVKPIGEVNDEVFSQGILGVGLAIEPEASTVIAPSDGAVTVVMDGSNHAVSMRVTNEIEILIHVGIDTVAMKGKGFQCMVTQGQAVQAGDELIRFDKRAIEEAGYGTDVILVIMAHEALPTIHFHTGMTAVANETVIADW